MSNEEYRRLPDELVTRYTFEPLVRDIYVEGEYDVAVLGWYLSTKKHDVGVYPVSTVKIENPQNTNGNKGRVIALMSFLDNEIPPTADGVRGIIDRDISTIANTLDQNRLIWPTDFASMDCYCWSPRILEKIFSLLFRRELNQKIIEGISTALQESFLARAAKHIVASEVKWITFTRCCTFESGQIKFDQEEHATRMYQSAGRMDVLNAARAWVVDARNQLAGDGRLYMHGHDLVEILSWIGLKMKVDKTICAEENLHRTLATCLEIEEISGYPLFQLLDAWAISAKAQSQ
ncbi:hypothetical protein [Variovorax atrisoli]|uniref:hypothetical protein n=1 Tax=Variovorax atrisoli TaxID=3394203 RepID=UPI0040402EA5